ncbi:MAG: CYTH domain-containing protein [Opitutales bacterium]|nr:CYTH domain-containing protein [Opitutales bacterium]
MGLEIERKFVVDASMLPDPEKAVPMEQGYLDHGQIAARVRIAGERAFLTLKGTGSGTSRAEFEYAIPLEDARELLRSCSLPGRVAKTRRYYRHGGRLWEVDVFGGANEGLVLAEVELESEDAAVDVPPWVTREVSGDPRYFNAYLARHPYGEWRGDEASDNLEGGGT